MSRHIPKAIKEAVRHRDGDRCRKCGERTEYPEWDHITPYSKGGPSSIENVQMLCRRCNLKKGAKTLDCRKCGGWNAHNASYCQWCKASIRSADKRAFVAKNPIDYRRLIGKLLLVIAIVLVVYSLTKK